MVSNLNLIEKRINSILKGFSILTAVALDNGYNLCCLELDVKSHWLNHLI